MPYQRLRLSVALLLAATAAACGDGSPGRVQVFVEPEDTVPDASRRAQRSRSVARNGS